MKNRLLSFIKKYQFVFFSFLLAFTVLFITSKNSPLYPFNDWVDENAFFTVGKGIFKGVVPYRDVFEQKGLLLYFLFGIASLISYKSFLGVFFIEVLFFSIFLYYGYKTIKMFLDEKYTYIILPFLSFLITTCISFVHGGACEEFCLPFLGVGLYSYFKHFKEKELTKKEFFLNGVMAGCIFMMKYTLLGFYFAFMLFLFFDFFFRKKEYKKSFLACAFFLLGMAIPILLGLLYLGIHHGIKDFIDCYFVTNMTAYNRETVTILEKLNKIFTGTISLMAGNGILMFAILILLPLALVKLKIPTYAKFSFIGIFVINTIFLFFGIRFYYYYFLPLVIFLIPSLIGLFSFTDKKIYSFMQSKFFSVVSIGVFIVVLCLTYTFANYKHMIGMKKEELFQYKYAEYICEFDHPTLLNMGYLDAGLYTTTGIVPNTKFFEVQNIPYDKFPDNLDDMRYNVENKNIQFILYFTRMEYQKVLEKDSYILEHYDLVFDDSQDFEGDLYHAFLFQVKEG